MKKSFRQTSRKKRLKQKNKEKRKTKNRQEDDDFSFSNTEFNRKQNLVYRRIFPVYRCVDRDYYHPSKWLSNKVIRKYAGDGSAESVYK